MQIVISALHFPWTSMADCCRRVRDELGLDGIELSWHPNLTRPHCTATDLDELAASRRSHGLALSAHIWDNPAAREPEDAATALCQWLPTCSRAGVTTLVLHGGRWPNQEAGIERVRRAIAAAAPRFAAAGVTLCLENHYAFDYQDCCELLSEPWEFRQVLDRSQRALGFCLDTGHAHMTRNWHDLIRDLAPVLRYVHLADCHGVHDDHLGFRQGSVPWDGVFDALAGIGFDGTFCVEFPVRDDLAPFRSCLQELRARFGGKPPRPAGDPTLTPTRSTTGGCNVWR